MMVRQIDQVFWYHKRQCMVVTYRDGDPDRVLTTTEKSAEVLSAEAGLVLVPSLPGVVRWVRHPESMLAA
jgi:hypothetical protein